MSFSYTTVGVVLGTRNPFIDYRDISPIEIIILSLLAIIPIIFLLFYNRKLTTKKRRKKLNNLDSKSANKDFGDI